LVDEALSRRADFRDGRKIRLADGQTWSMPPPPNASEWGSPPFDAVYTGLVSAIAEAETRHERHLAELSLAIFLLGHNYCLDPQDYEQLLSFSPDSADLTEWQSAFRNLAQEHLHCSHDASRLTLDDGPTLPQPGRFYRLLAWFRDHLPSRWWVIRSRVG
jgi:hypothetical protein